MNRLSTYILVHQARQLTCAPHPLLNFNLFPKIQKPAHNVEV